LSFCLMLVKTVTVFLSIGGYSNRVPSWSRKIPVPS
jgi:hypothetical protein